MKNGTAQRVLFAQAGAKLSSPIALALRNAGYFVSIAGDTNAVTQHVTTEHPNFVLIDSELPGIGSARLCQWIRTEHDLADIWIIMFGAIPGISDQPFALDPCADDYLFHPFEMEELLKRISTPQHRLRMDRDRDRLKHILRAGSIEMMQDQWVVYVDGTSANLTETEYRLLRELLEVKGRVLTRDDLLERVWGYQRAFNIESRTLDVHMSRLRHKLGSSAKNLITVRNVGYRINISPEWLNH